MAESEGKTPSKRELDDLGVPNPESFRDRADDVIPKKDSENAAYHEAITADSYGAEAKAKAKQTKASPDAPATPSGAALLATAGKSSDVDRGEEYARVKAAVRHGIVAPEDAGDVA